MIAIRNSRWVPTRSSTSSSTPARGFAPLQWGDLLRSRLSSRAGRSRAPQARGRGILVNYTGGQVADTFATGIPNSTRRFLAQIEPVLPGLSSHWNGRATVDWWGVILIVSAATATGRSVNTLALPGVEREPQGSVRFCGEHTSIDAQGYLEGAVWKQASELRMRSSRLCAKSQSSLSNRRACKVRFR